MPVQPNMKTLLIPHKTQAEVKQPEYGNDMRQIEQWANALKTAAYASLTGPGQTSATGTLTQTGPFIVNDPVNGGIQFIEGSGGFAILNGNGGMTISDGGGGMTIRETSGGAMTISDSGTGGNGIIIEQIGGATSGGIDIHNNNTSTGSAVNICHSLDNLSFFQGANTPQQTVTGSRGGNAALASLLTALANYGLIVDSTTP